MISHSGLFRYACFAAIGMVLMAALPLQAKEGEPDPARFQQAIYALQQKLVSEHKVRVEEEDGRYPGVSKDYTYQDRRYYDTASGKLISHVRVDGSDPKIVHIVEVNIYDAEGRVIRDFGSLSVPWAPVRPINTFINFHRYNGQLHSYRQYDVFGGVNYEFCEGKFNGRDVHIALDDDDLLNLDPAAKTTDEYKACFDGMPADWADYASNPR